MVQENDDQIKKLKDLVNAGDESEIEVIADCGAPDIRVFSSDERGSREHLVFTLYDGWNSLIEDVNCDDEFGEEQRGALPS